MASIEYTVLTDKDKLGIVNSHIKNKEYAIYNDELEKLGEVNSETPDEKILEAINSRSGSNISKLSALKAEAEKLKASVYLEESKKPE